MEGGDNTKYWFAKRVMRKLLAPANDAHTLMRKGWTPVAFAGFGDSITAVTLVKS